MKSYYYNFLLPRKNDNANIMFFLIFFFFFFFFFVEGVKTLLPGLSQSAFRPLQIVSSNLRILAAQET